MSYVGETSDAMVVFHWKILQLWCIVFLIYCFIVHSVIIFFSLIFVINIVKHYSCIFLTCFLCTALDLNVLSQC